MRNCQIMRQVRLLLVFPFLAFACVASPQADASEQAVRGHFQKIGYEVEELSLGRTRRNPIDERVYMAPLTYVVEVSSITLAARTREGTWRRLSSTGGKVKVQALSGSGKEWVVSSVEGIDLP